MIANWCYGLQLDAGAILLNMHYGQCMAENEQRAIEDSGDTVADLHVWPVGPGHMSAVVRRHGDPPYELQRELMQWQIRRHSKASPSPPRPATAQTSAARLMQ